MLVKELAVSFFEAFQKSWQPKTTHSYRGRLKPFITKFGGTHIEKLNQIDIEEYLASVNKGADGQHWRPDTIRLNISSLKRLLDFAVEIDALKKSFTLPTPPAGTQRVRSPKPSEILAIKANSSPAFCLILDAIRICGARPGQLASATVANWDRISKCIVEWKPKHWEIPVGKRLEALLLESLNGRTHGPLFLTERHKPWTSAHLSASFRRAKIAAGLDKDLVLDSVRDEFAERLRKAEVEIQDSFDVLGG